MRAYTHEGSLILVSEDRGYLKTVVFNLKDNTTTTSTTAKLSEEGYQMQVMLATKCREVTAVLKALAEME